MSDHPRLPGRLSADVRPSDVAWPLVRSETGFENGYLSLTVDTIASADGEEHPRVVVHPHNAVGVAALDENDRILLVEQYRHPMGRRMLEIPAGIMDVAGESAQKAAARELAEEADVLAQTWQPLVKVAPTVGYSTEQIELFVATDLRPVPVSDRIERVAEEADMSLWWVELAEAVEAVRDGRIQDAKTMVAILSVALR